MNWYVASLLLSAVALCSPHIEEEWEVWRQDYKKVYTDALDEQSHKAIWMANYHKVREHNDGGHSYTLGLNEFADMADDEYSEMLLSSSIEMYTESLEQNYHESGSSSWYPDTMDWRNFGFVTRVKSQGTLCKSSWAFSATAALEAQHRKVWGQLVSLSEQQLIDCSGTYGNKGCTGGTVQNAFEYVHQTGGVCAENSYSYLGYGWYCVSKFCKKVTTCTGYVSIAAGNEDDLLDAIYSIGPVSVSIDASDYNLRYYQSGIYCNQDCSKTELNHSLLLVGYGSDGSQNYWILKNSWGTSWGQNGYMLLARNQNNTCGIASAASYPTVVFT